MGALKTEGGARAPPGAHSTAGLAVRIVGHATPHPSGPRIRLWGPLSSRIQTLVIPSRGLSCPREVAQCPHL